MRRLGTLAASGLLMAAVASAQGPLPPAAPGVPTAPPAPAVVPAPVAVDPILMAHLRNWETVMKSADNFYAEVKVARENKVRKSKTDLVGSIMCKKPGQARMRLEDVVTPGTKPDPFSYIAYIATGKAVWEYSGYDKLVTETRLPEGETSKGNMLLDFLSGAVSADEAVKRFSIKLLKDDTHYVYLELTSLTDDDKVDFSVMKMVFFKNLPGLPAYLPRQVILTKPNGQEEEVWNFDKVGINVPGIKPEYFTPAPVDPGWKYVKQDAPRKGQRGLPPAGGGPAIPVGLERPVVPTPGGPFPIPTAPPGSIPPK